MIQKVLGFGACRKKDAEVRRLAITSAGDTIEVGVYRDYRTQWQELSVQLDRGGTMKEFHLVYHSEHLGFAAAAYEITITPAYAMFAHVGGVALRTTLPRIRT